MAHDLIQLRSLLRHIYSYFPIILILVGIAGILITGVVIGRPDLAVRSLVLAIPLILAGVLLLFNKRANNGLGEISTHGWVRFGHLSMIFIILMILSIIVLYINHDRPLEYFLLILLMSGLIFLQILKSDSKMKVIIVLMELSILSLCLIWGVTLNYPLYYGGTDPLPHLYLIDTIADTGHIDELGASYVNFPLFHILIDTSFQICGLPLQTTLFLVMGLIWPIGIIVIYLIAIKLQQSRSLALIACLLFALNAAVIQFGMYPVTRSFAFIFYLFIILQLIPPHTKPSKYFFIQAIFLISLILAHHFTALLSIFIFLFIYIINIIVIKSPQEERVSGTFVTLFGVAFFTYLGYIAYVFTKSTISVNMRKFMSKETTNVSGIVSDHQYALAFIINNSYAGIALFLSLLGVGYIIMKTQRHSRRDYFIALICLLSLALYVPGAQYLLSVADDFLFYRIQLLLAPFIALGMAIGIKYLLSWNAGIDRPHRHSHGLLVLICVMVVMVTAFSSILSNNNSADSSDLRHDNSNTRYFLTSEITSLLFTSHHANSSLPLFSDYFTMRNKYHLSDFDSLKVLTSGNTTYISEGYVILRIDELVTTDTLALSSDGSIDADAPYRLSDQPDDTNILHQLDRECAIYNNGAVEIFLMGYRGDYY